MSGYGALRQRTQEAGTPPVDETRCAASGCPCRASVNLEGRWACSAHGFAAFEDWPRITERLREFGWLLAFTDDVAKHARMPRSYWREFASEFWADQDLHCVPDAKESAEAYGYRMRGEMLWRCGLTAKRPKVRLPKEPTGRRGNAAAFLGETA